MTATALPTRATASGSHRIGAVVRLHLANPWTAIIWPWIITGVILVFSIAIWLILLRAIPSAQIGDISDGVSYSGSATFIFVYMMVVAVTAVSATFPYALGFGVTRRDFALGTAATFVLLSASFAIGMAVLSLIEEVTGGWGVGGRMFTAGYFGDGDWLSRLWIYFVTFLFFFFVGSVFAAVWVRFRATGLTTLFIGLGAVVVGAVALVTLTGSWPAVGGFFATWGWVGSYTWSLVPTAIAALAGYLVLRRATPRE